MGKILLRSYIYNNTYDRIVAEMTESYKISNEMLLKRGLFEKSKFLFSSYIKKLKIK